MRESRTSPSTVYFDFAGLFAYFGLFSVQFLCSSSIFCGVICMFRTFSGGIFRRLENTWRSSTIDFCASSTIFGQLAGSLPTGHVANITRLWVLAGDGRCSCTSNKKQLLTGNHLSSALGLSSFLPITTVQPPVRLNHPRGDELQFQGGFQWTL